jgi:hypothetical protein
MSPWVTGSVYFVENNVLFRSPCTSVSEADCELDNRCSIPGKQNDIFLSFCVLQGCRAPPPPQPATQFYGLLFPWGQSRPGVATHLHLTLRSKMRGAMPPLSHTSARSDAQLSTGGNVTFFCHDTVTFVKFKVHTTVFLRITDT